MLCPAAAGHRGPPPRPSGVPARGACGAYPHLACAKISDAVGSGGGGRGGWFLFSFLFVTRDPFAIRMNGALSFRHSIYHPPGINLQQNKGKGKGRRRIEGNLLFVPAPPPLLPFATHQLLLAMKLLIKSVGHRSNLIRIQSDWHPHDYIQWLTVAYFH